MAYAAGLALKRLGEKEELWEEEKLAFTDDKTAQVAQLSRLHAQTEGFIFVNLLGSPLR